MANPCGSCMSVKAGVLAIAIVEAIYAAILLIVIGVAFWAAETMPLMIKMFYSGDVARAGVILLLVVLPYEVLISIVLIIAAVTKNYDLCRIWKYLTIVASLGLFVFSIISIITRVGFELSLPILVTHFLRFYAIRVVSAFMVELKCADEQDIFADTEQQLFGHSDFSNRPIHNFSGQHPTIPGTTVGNLHNPNSVPQSWNQINDIPTENNTSPSIVI